MDETLIHCVDDIQYENPHHIIAIQFDDEPGPVEAGINIWPYAIECLEELSKHFYIVVWTASIKPYADAVLNLIDPNGQFIQNRFYRN